jgi:hypothetical protein
VGGDPQFLWGSFSGDVLDASDFGGWQWLRHPYDSDGSKHRGNPRWFLGTFAWPPRLAVCNYGTGSSGQQNQKVPWQWEELMLPRQPSRMCLGRDPRLLEWVGMLSAIIP